jgi:hypothetical protein
VKPFRPRVALLFLVALLLPAGAFAEKVELYAYTLKHQRANEALEVIRPLLSSQGTIELRPTDNTLVIRDTLTALGRVVPALKQYDHPPRQLTIEVTIVQARRANYSPLVPEETLAPELAKRLKLLLPFSTYRVLATTTLHTLEGEEVTYELGDGFGVGFRPGTVRTAAEGGPAQVKLAGFRVSRLADGVRRRLLSTTMSLRLDQPTALTLAGNEAANTALVVVLTPSLAGNAAARARQ